MKSFFASIAIVVTGALTAIPNTAFAQNRIFVGTVAGSDLDGLARRVAEVLAEIQKSELRSVSLAVQSPAPKIQSNSPPASN